ncbi:MAG: hypothetical protein LUO91_02940 [Methanomicrobiales archaeon]|nr:hypothetical protein [Methanomicrobiales archaeon]
MGVVMGATDKKVWQDERAFHLYSIINTSNDRTLRRQAMQFLGALVRAGSNDAAWAMDRLRNLK